MTFSRSTTTPADAPDPLPPGFVPLPHREPGDEHSAAERLARAIGEALSRLSPSEQLLLRALSVVGPEADIDRVSSLLGVEPVKALEGLQAAVDAGVPIGDAGDGRLSLPEPLAAFLRATTLPSLVSQWNRRLEASGAAPPRPRQPASPPASPRASAQAAPPAREPAAPRQPPSYAELFGPSGPVAAKTAPRQPAAQPETSDEDDAVTRLLSAATQAASAGQYSKALTLGREAASLLERAPGDNRRRWLTAQVLSELGRLQWQGAGPGADFSLSAALATLERASGLLGPGAPGGLRAQVASLTAEVAHDLGDRERLDGALAQLAGAIAAVMAEGDEVAAAKLLCDEASLYLRMEAPAPAVSLLEQASQLAANRASADPAALAVLAGAHHLLARLPLHMQMRQGREPEALDAGRQHGEAALQAYGQLGASREAARVGETMARLELLAGEPEKAERRLQAVLEQQVSSGDVVGLSRSTAAMAEALSALGRPEQALGLLGDSVMFNLEKGSPLGLRFNRRALDALRKTSPASPDAIALGKQIEEAERALSKGTPS